jgi:hypothetical protein
MSFIFEAVRGSGMSSDPNDELARLRSRRGHDRAAPRPDAVDDVAPGSPEQQAAIARARESWLLSRPNRDEPAEGDASDRE